MKNLKTFFLILYITPFLWASDLLYVLKNSWNTINLDEAYKNNAGINGLGISLGIIDSTFNTNHKSLKGKDEELINVTCCERGSSSTMQDIRHGSHVAGIAIGAKLGDKDPHGIAYMGKYYGLGKLNPRLTYRGNLYEDVKDWNVKIINNSWEAANYYPLINIGLSNGYENIKKDSSSLSAAYYFDTLLAYKISGKPHDVLHLIRLAKEKKILNVFGAGNDGRISPSAAAVAASYDEDLRSWIVVGALDADGIRVSNVNGKRTLSIKSGKCTSSSGISYECSGAAIYSNALKGAQLYGITAPGTNIDSANAYFDAGKIGGKEEMPLCGSGTQEDFCAMSGTSMATPMVSGAAMLVQQKFAFLDGSQIADVLLTTANSDFEAPELIVKRRGRKSLYNVIYIDKDPPKTSQGEIDTDKVKEDLKRLAYSDSEVEEIFKSLITIGGSEGIVRLSKEEVFGQGILDVNKALSGLARLDINRLNAKDVQYFAGESQAFYTLNTRGMDGEFGNNIEQRLWDDRWHFDGARNSPRQALKDLKRVGLLKLGQGKLSLSGSNSYEGATRVLEGVLELKGVLTASDAYAERRGIFLLSSGIVNKNAHAHHGGVIKLEGSGTVQGRVYAQDGGRIELGSQSSTRLHTEGVVLTSGGVLAGAGQIASLSQPRAAMALSSFANGSLIGGKTQLKNQSGLVMAGFGALPISSVDESLHSLSVDGSYFQGKEGRLQIAFDVSSIGPRNSKLIANDYEIEGGMLEFVPIGRGTWMKVGKSIYLDLGNLKAHTQKFDHILPRGNNILDLNYQHAEQTLTPYLKRTAFHPSDLEDFAAGDAVQTIYLQEELPKTYQEYFAAIADIDKTIYQRSNDSLAQNASLISARDALNASKQLALENLAFLLSRGPNPKSEFLIDVAYGYLEHADYNTRKLGLSLKFNHLIHPALLVGGFLDLSNSHTTQTYTQASANRLWAGLNGIYDASYLSVLGSVSLGLGFNQTKREILNPTSNHNALLGKHNNYLVSTQIGVAKDFGLSSFVLQPMIALSYTALFQKAYEEKGAIFAKSYDGGVHNDLLSSLGLQVTYAKDMGQLELRLNAFGFYNLHFLNTLKNKAAFIDSLDASFVQQIAIERHSFLSGLGAEIYYGSYFARLGLSHEVGKKYFLLNTNLTVGINF